MTNRIISVFLLCLFALGIFGCSSNNGSPNIVLKLGTDAAHDYATTIANRQMAEIVKNKTNGRIIIEVYANAQLGDGKELIEAIQMNAVQLATVGVLQMAEFKKEFAVLETPYLIVDQAHLDKVLDGDIGRRWLAMDDIGIVGLTFYDSAPRSFYNSRSATEKPEDLKGMKVRTTSAPMMIETLKILGAVPTPVPFSEVYQALQNRVVIGAENDITSYLSKGHFEVAKYFTSNEHTMVPDILIMSKKAMDKLSEADREIIIEAAKKSHNFQRAEQAKRVEAAYAKLKEYGVIFTKVDKGPWIAATESVIDKQSDSFKSLVTQIRDMK